MWTSSIAARLPWAWTASVMRARVGMSRSSHRRIWLLISEVGWMSHCSVATTAQPPSALMPRITAISVGRPRPMPLQWGTW